MTSSPHNPLVGLIITDDGIYLHAEDLVDSLNTKAALARDHLDFDMYEQYDNFAREIQQLIESEINK